MISGKIASTRCLLGLRAAPDVRDEGARVAGCFFFGGTVGSPLGFPLKPFPKRGAPQKRTQEVGARGTLSGKSPVYRKVGPLECQGLDKANTKPFPSGKNEACATPSDIWLDSTGFHRRWSVTGGPGNHLRAARVAAKSRDLWVLWMQPVGGFRTSPGTAWLGGLRLFHLTEWMCSVGCGSQF